jgi:hypothetical protein
MTFKAIPLRCLLFLAYLHAAQAKAETSRVLACFDAILPISTFDFPSQIDMTHTDIVELDGAIVYAHGTLGWHTTWGVLFDFNASPAHAYETYGSKGDIVDAFGRMRVPASLTAGLVACGLEWKGLWLQEWPDKEHAGPVLDADAILSTDDLLPPSE